MKIKQMAPNFYHFLLSYMFLSLRYSFFIDILWKNKCQSCFAFFTAKGEEIKSIVLNCTAVVPVVYRNDQTEDGDF